MRVFSIRTRNMADLCAKTQIVIILFGAARNARVQSIYSNPTTIVALLRRATILMGWHRQSNSFVTLKIVLRAEEKIKYFVVLSTLKVYEGM